MKERRDKGLCYYYDDKWLPGHKCKSPRLYLMSGLEVPLEDPPEDMYYDSMDLVEPVPEFDVVECKEPEISISARNKHKSDRQFKIHVFIGGLAESTGEHPH
jgi:hypothetical protein